ncbi:MAG TPA: type II 3-dehydroquinate dehydratase [Candidatus Eisenbacteria bacterium]|nr:type II 3-dehydroquinate dehydratase [Candidatus Eisenbacteria bacterium]
MRILVLDGPNLNLLGQREPDVYGTATLQEIEAGVRRTAEALGVAVEFAQSNHEGALIDALHAAPGRFEGVLLNPGALTHTSLALYDALLAVGLPAVEVHLSNLWRREEFRRESRTGAATVGVVMGFGAASYEWGLRALVAYVQGRAAR